MAIPLTGTIKISDIYNELTQDFNPPTLREMVGLKGLEEGSFGMVNANSTYKPGGGVLGRRMSEWRGYDQHAFRVGGVRIIVHNYTATQVVIDMGGYIDTAPIEEYSIIIQPMDFYLVDYNSVNMKNMYLEIIETDGTTEFTSVNIYNRSDTSFSTPITGLIQNYNLTPLEGFPSTFTAALYPVTYDITIVYTIGTSSYYY